MNNRIRETFDQIHAETELKEQTKHVIAYQIKKHSFRKKSFFKQLAPVMACCLLLLSGFGGYRLYFTRTSIISIDINPSIELNINRFDRVISVSSYNDEGRKLADTADLQFKDYRNAISELLNTENISVYLKRNEMLSISVIGGTEEKSMEMLANIETCISNHSNICCYAGNFDDVQKAHSAGLSVGKYRAFLELQKINPDITVEQIKELTMRQIRNLTDNLPEDGNRPHCNGNPETGGNGNCHRHQNGTEYKQGTPSCPAQDTSAGQEP